MSTEGFKLTYGTMFNPPEELHTRYEVALDKVCSQLGQEHGMIINGQDVFTDDKFEDRSPANTDVLLGVFQKGGAKEAKLALESASRAFEEWSRTDYKERVALVRKAASIMDRRTYEMAAVISLEVGKNRMEALGDVAETADLLRYACEQMEANKGYVTKMGKDPFSGYSSTNTSVLLPHGVWLVISPFNFPCALTGGPVGAALVAGNTVVIKPATDTPWTSRLIAECLWEAGLPAGVCNYVTGPGNTLGQALIESPLVAGVTFTGSYDVGMKIFRDYANSRWVRPIILELGGKNPALVSRNADLEQAATGILRSAFGLQGQKCSACSRVFIEEPVYEELTRKLVALTETLVIGDPTERKTYLGPVINMSSFTDFKRFCEDLSQNGRFLTGGKVLASPPYDKGYFCEPTLVADLPLDHPLWQKEMFVPITTLAPVKSLEEGMRLANNVEYGLTAGFYGSAAEADWFFENIKAGVCYANRPQGATTGAWPGFQPFGGWKASGATGKNAGGLYYLPLYMREQIHCRVQKGE